MSNLPPRQKLYQFTMALLMVIALSAIVVLFIRLHDARTDIDALRQDTPDTNNQDSVADVRDDFGSLMDVVQAIGVLFGFIAAGAALFGFSSFTQVGERVEKIDEALEKATNTQQDVDHKVADLNKLEARIEETRRQTEHAAFALASTQLAQHHMRLGNDKVALQQLQMAHQQDPANETIAFLLGDIMSRQEDFLGAEAILRDNAHAEMVINGRFAKPWAAGTYAYVLRLVGSNMPAQRDAYWAKSNAIFERLWADEDQRSLLDTHGESVYGAWAGLLQRQGHLDRAIEKYKHAAQVTLRNSYPINNLGLIHFEQHHLADAQRYFWIARRKALGKFLTNSDDYYAVFDVITARVAISAIVAEDPNLPIQGHRLAEFETAVMPPNDILIEDLALAMEAPKPLNQLADGLDRLLKAEWFQKSGNVEDVRDQIINIQVKARAAANRI